MKNKSGIKPVGHRILVLPDVAEKVTKAGIIIPVGAVDREQDGADTGLVVEVGPDAWTLDIHKQPWAKVGDKVCFARYAGKMIKGNDGKNYRLMNDEDILAEKE